MLRDQVIKFHVTQWLHTISTFPPKLIYVSFFKLFCNTENWLNKVRQLLKSEIKSSCYKVITKCDKNLLQSASGITKCDRLLLQSVSGITKCGRLLLQSVTDCYYKVRQVLQSVTDCYYKVRQVLQSATVITKLDVTGTCNHL